MGESTEDGPKMTKSMSRQLVSRTPGYWSELGRGARAFRTAHAAIALIELGCLGYVWICALTGRRDRLLAGSLFVLSAQGAALIIGRGKCPLGPLQERLGDPEPLFQLLLPPRAAKA